MQHLALASDDLKTGAALDDSHVTDVIGGKVAIPETPSALVHAEVYWHDGERDARRTPSLTAFTLDDIVGCLGAYFPADTAEDLLLALVAVYMYRTSHQPAVAMAVRDGVPAAQRHGDTTLDLGFAPLLVSVDGGQAFAAVLDAIRAERSVLSAMPAGVHGRTSVGGNLWSTPVPFAVTLTDDAQAWAAGDADVELVIDRERRQGTLVADAGLLPEFTTVILVHLKTLAQAVARHPAELVDRLSCLGAAERQRILNDLNRTDATYPFDGGLVARFEAQVKSTPDHPAVIFQGTCVTYAEFNGRVNRLARHLRGLGVGPESVVAICLDRSIEMVVAIWAVLKAGGAYVPLNVEDPPQRLSSIIRNADANVALTDDRLAKKLPRTRLKVVRLAASNPSIDELDADDLKLRIGEKQLAYMIYTSGSTGEPKGVLIEHKAIHNRITWMQETYQLTPDDRVLQKTPYTFDVSVWEFLWPLTVGATLVVAEPGGHVVPSYLIRLMRQEKITCVHFVPSVLRLFLRSPGIEKLPLRMVFCSGEALATDLRDSLFARSSCELHNLYGPTEAAVDVSFYRCRGDSRSRRIPIGKPIANIRLHVLGDDLQPVPVGVAGELYIGGVGLARGYWRRPELTADRFIADPLRQEEGERLYKTGDVVRYLPDGDIEYLGRNDHQVKINGARVELGEIEAVIRNHSMVQDSVVIANKSDAGNAQLFAYLVMKENGKGAAALEHLREQLDRRLPPSMIPRTFTVLPRIPLTPSGKVDRKALPAPQSAM